MAWVVGIGIFIFLLCAFPRQIGAIILVIVGIITLFWVYSEHNNRQKENAIKKINLFASIQSALCSDPIYPISVRFFNGTSKTINSISFTISAKREGFSSTIYSRYLNSDKILPANTEYSACWSISDYDLKYGEIKNYPLESLTWSATANNVIFAQ